MKTAPQTGSEKVEDFSESTQSDMLSPNHELVSPFGPPESSVEGKKMAQTNTYDLSEQEFTEKYGYCWDYCMIFPTMPLQPGETLRQPTELCRQSVKKLQEAGLETKCFYSFANDEVYCKIRAPLDRLEAFADFCDWKFLLNRHKLKELAEGGNPGKNITGFKINDSPDISKYPAYEYIYGKYDTDEALRTLYQPEAVMNKDEEIKHPFRNALRLQLIAGIIKARRDKSGAQLKPRNMLYEGLIKGFFPLHNNKTKARLEESWTWRSWPWVLPFEQIKNYFGEQVGMYFQFLAHYTKWVLGPSIIGLIVVVVTYTQGKAEGPLVACYAVFICLWAIFMLEFWKRKQAQVQLHWGMKGIEREQPDRPEFKGEKMSSPVDGSDILYFPPKRQRTITYQSRSVICTCIIIVLGFVAGVFGLRYYLIYISPNNFASTHGAKIGSVINGIQINLLNLVYQRIAIWMTDRENHRTDHKYQDSLITKLFLFQFINSYSSFFYIAFIQDRIESGCDAGTCMETLMINLIIIFLENLVFLNLLDVAIPYVKHKWTLHKELDDVRGRGDAKSASAVEYEFTLDVYDDIMGTLMDYLNLTIQFGYLTLFVAAFPLAPLFALGNNYVSIHADAYRLLHMMQRPVPQPCQDIGTWQVIFTILVIISVVTNAGLLCFIMEGVLDGYSMSTRLWVFVIIQYVIFTLMYTIQLTVPDTPHDVLLQHQRTDFLVSKIIERISDEEEEAGFELEKISDFQLEVYPTDDVAATLDFVDKVADAGAEAVLAVNKAGKDIVSDTNAVLCKAGKEMEAAAGKMVEGLSSARPKTGGLGGLKRQLSKNSVENKERPSTGGMRKPHQIHPETEELQEEKKGSDLV
mmetsp:Transcript_1336/g.1776  ORF Transcript_1336/g.1776 Transcript_1336/m.1776 type:complete len:861 (+) Transcript_1336:116-2698(+)